MRELSKSVVDAGSESVRPPALSEPPANGLARAHPAELVQARPARRVQPRVLIAVVLIAAGIVWAIARGLNWYGLSPMNVIYDLDQPPLLLILVGGWLWYRSRRR